MKTTMSHHDTPALESNDDFIDLNDYLLDLSTETSSLTICSLMIIAGNQAITRRLYENDFLELGRFEEPNRSQLDLKLLMNPDDGVSRRHAMFCYTGEQLQVLDLESKNGLYLNGDRLQAKTFYPVENGDCLLLGNLELCMMVKISELN